ALGNGSTASGSAGAVAVGAAAVASGSYGTALGSNSTASVANSVALGYNALTTSAATATSGGTTTVSSATIGGQTFGNFAGAKFGGRCRQRRAVGLGTPYPERRGGPRHGHQHRRDQRQPALFGCEHDDVEHHESVDVGFDGSVVG
ncbi:hypothetical protein A8D83_23370, partial [Burkholderia cenocepacia]